MTKFNVNDWVQITPQPDLKWDRWNNNQEYYNNFAGKIGYVSEIENYEDSEEYFCISVEFPHEISDGYSYLPAGTYSEWFKSDHLIRSSKYEATRKYSQIKAEYDLQEWEKFKKKTTDDALRSVFAPEAPKQKKVPKPVVFDEWDEITNPYDCGYDQHTHNLFSDD